MSNLFKSISLILFGLILGAVSLQWLGKNQNNIAVMDNKPLYWVAPMDANFRRDEPGKSPMGMDLVPVYANDQEDNAAGVVSIAPHIINNLGVRSELVVNKKLLNKIHTVGIVQYDQENMIHIHPRVAGWLNKLHIKTAGELVKQGQPLYDIYSPDLVHAQEELILGLTRGNKHLVSAAQARLRSLLVPEKTIQNVMRSRQVQQQITIYAPQSGVVDNLAAREGGYVKPGSQIMSVATLEQVWVHAQVFERDVSAISVGDLVVMSIDYWPGQQWDGKVDYIYPTLDENTRTLSVRIRFDNQSYKLKPNMFGHIVISSESAQPSLLVSRKAVIRTGDTNRVVLDLGEGAYKSVNVSIGRSNSGFIEVLSGLEAGDKVVTSAQFLLDSESSVSSDFMRMDSSADAPLALQQVQVTVVVESLMAKQRMVTLTHPPIVEWDWPEMTMDFTLAEDLTLDAFKVGESLEVMIADDGEFGYSVIKIIGSKNNAHRGVDHSEHSTMHQH